MGVVENLLDWLDISIVNVEALIIHLRHRYVTFDATIVVPSNYMTQFKSNMIDSTYYAKKIRVEGEVPYNNTSRLKTIVWNAYGIVHVYRSGERKNHRRDGLNGDLAQVFRDLLMQYGVDFTAVMHLNSNKIYIATEGAPYVLTLVDVDASSDELLVPNDTLEALTNYQLDIDWSRDMINVRYNNYEKVTTITSTIPLIDHIPVVPQTLNTVVIDDIIVRDDVNNTDDLLIQMLMLEAYEALGIDRHIAEPLVINISSSRFTDEMMQTASSLISNPNYFEIVDTDSTYTLRLTSSDNVYSCIMPKNIVHATARVVEVINDRTYLTEAVINLMKAANMDLMPVIHMRIRETNIDNIYKYYELLITDRTFTIMLRL